MLYPDSLDGVKSTGLIIGMIPLVLIIREPFALRLVLVIIQACGFLTAVICGIIEKVIHKRMWH